MYALIDATSSSFGNMQSSMADHLTSIMLHFIHHYTLTSFACLQASFRFTGDDTLKGEDDNSQALFSLEVHV